ncbi:MAG: amidohydrolase family protein [Sulfitobacter sp.]|nr:amidohydrolase family protein [Sulfitobacter sp.]
MTTPPDLIIVNGALITFDPTTQGATSIAIVGNKIHAIGTDAEMRGLAGPDTQVVDAAQATVMPGFIDSHVHLFCGSVELGYLDLHGIQGFAALKAAVAPYSDATPDDAILFAVQADYAILHSDKTPTRQELDSVCPHRPFAIFAPDHHTVWANTAALQLAGIIDGGETAAGCEIVMGDDGMATGELREPGAYAAVLALTRHGGRDLAGLISGKDPVPTPSAADRAKDKAALARGMKHCAAQGITGVQCMDGNFYQLELLTEMEAEGTLLCRTSVPFHLRPKTRLTG